MRYPELSFRNPGYEFPGIKLTDIEKQLRQKKYLRTLIEADILQTWEENKIFSGRTVVVTGVTGLIGRALSEQLAFMGSNLIILGRDSARVEIIASRLARASRNPIIKGIELNLADQESILRVTEQLEETGSIDVLVNNAGLTPSRRQKNIVGVNYLGTSLFTLSLLPLIRRGNQPQVVNISSRASHDARREDFRFGLNVRTGSLRQAYADSKLALDSFTFALAQSEEDVQFYSVHPGLVIDPFKLGFLMRPFRRFILTPDEAALGLVGVIHFEEGGRYEYGERTSPPQLALDSGFSKKLLLDTIPHIHPQLRATVESKLHELLAA